jgi:hypothetical protein
LNGAITESRMLGTRATTINIVHVNDQNHSSDELSSFLLNFTNVKYNIAEPKIIPKNWIQKVVFI